jgi:hypothetical protein
MSLRLGVAERSILKRVEAGPLTVRQVCNETGAHHFIVQRAFRTLYKKGKIRLHLKPVLTALPLAPVRASKPVAPVRSAIAERPRYDSPAAPVRVLPPAPIRQPNAAPVFVPPPAPIRQPDPAPVRTKQAPPAPSFADTIAGLSSAFRSQAPKPVRNAAGGFDAIPRQSARPAQAAEPPPTNAADLVAWRLRQTIEKQKAALIAAGGRTVT